MENQFKRFLSLLVAVVMVASMIPTTVFASSNDLAAMTDEEVLDLCLFLAAEGNEEELSAVASELGQERVAAIEALYDQMQENVPVALADSTATVTAYKQVSYVTDVAVDANYYAQVGTAADLEAAVTLLKNAGADAGLILISEGTLVVSNRQDITMNNVIIKGAGQDKTTVTGDSAKFNNSTNGLANKNSLSSEYKAVLGLSASNVKVMDLTVDGGSCGYDLGIFNGGRADFKTVRINSGVAYLENLSILSSKSRSNLVIGTTNTTAVAYGNNISVAKAYTVYGDTEIVSGSTLTTVNSVLGGTVVGGTDNLGAGYYKLVHNGVTAYTTIPYAIECYNSGTFADMLAAYCTNEGVAEGVSVARAMTNDLVTVVSGQTTLLYGKNCSEMRALAVAFKAALAGLSADTNVDVADCLADLEAALALEQWHEVASDGTCDVCGAAGLEVPVSSPVVVPDTVVDSIVGENAGVSVETVTEIVNEIKENTALSDFEPTNVPENAELVIELAAMTVEDGTPVKIVYDVAPMAGEEKVQPEQAIIFRLPVPASVLQAYARVYHEGDPMGIYPIEGAGSGKYVEVSSASFSAYAVEPTDSALEDYVVLPDGMDASNYEALFGTNTVTDGTNYYATLKDALLGIHLTENRTLYCKPGADVGVMTHGHVCASLTVYGNGAKLTASGEQDFEIDTYKYCHNGENACEGVTAELTLTVKYLNGCGAWGQRTSENTVNLVFENCKDMNRVYVTGTVSANNITLTDCSFLGSVENRCTLYSNANGTISLSGVEFSNIYVPVNLNHKVAGTQTVSISDCSFTSCGFAEYDYAAPIRVLSSVEGAETALTVSGCTFTDTVANKQGQNADVLLDYGVGTTNASISGSAANVVLETEDNVGATTAVSADENQSFTNVEEPAVSGLSGEGTEASPYLISSLEELKWFRDDVNAGNTYSGEYVKLTADIDLNNEDWTPIGSSTNEFQGSFDGGSCTVSNLYINDVLDYYNGGESYVGLFGYIKNGGYIKNLNIVNADVTGCLYVGAVVGRVYIGGVIENCHVSGNIDIEGCWYVGGIAGRYEYATGIYNCSVKGTAENVAAIEADVDAETNKDADGSYVGGIVGFTTEPNPVVTISGNAVEYVKISGMTRVGGISGIAHYGNVFENNAVSNVGIYAIQPEGYDEDDADTIGLIAGACQGTEENPVTFTNCTATNTTAYLNGEVIAVGEYGETIDGTTPVTNYKAAIGTKNYETLAEAITAVQEGETITLLDHVTLSEGVTVTGDTSFTLDGNGYSITPADETVNLGYQAVYFNGSGTYTLENLTFKGFKQANVSAVVLRLESAEQFCLNNVTFEDCDVAKSTRTEYSVMRVYNTNMVADGLNFSGCKGSMLMDIGPSSEKFAGDIVIKNSTFEGNTVKGTALIYPECTKDGEGSLTVQNSTFTNNMIGDADSAEAAGRGVIHLSANATIDGCTFDGNTVYGSHAANVSYGINNYSDYTLVYSNNTFRNNAAYQTNANVGAVSGVAMMAVGDATLSGNTVEDSNKFYNRASTEAEFAEQEARSVGAYSTNYGTTSIESGTYNGALAVYSGSDAIQVSGGTYSTDVSDYCVDGFICELKSDGTYGIEVDPAYGKVAKVGDVYFETLADAFAAAQRGDTITLLDNITLTEGVSIMDPDVLCDITLDGNGKTITLDMNGTGTGIRFGGEWAIGVKIYDLTVTGSANYAIWFNGGTTSELTNVTVTGEYNAVYGALILYGTHGATLTNCDIVSGFVNGQDDYPLTLVSSRIGSLVANVSEADDGAKVFIDEDSSVETLLCCGNSTVMIDSASLSRVDSYTTEEGDVVAQVGNVQYATLQAAVNAAVSGDTVILLADVTVTDETVTLNGVNLTAGEGITLTNSGTIEVYGEVILNISTLSGSSIDLMEGAIIKDSNVGGKVYVGGNVIFRGDNTFTMITDYGDYYSSTTPSKWTVEKGATLTLTSTDRYGLGYGDQVTIYGDIEDALTARENLTEEDATVNMYGGLVGMTNSASPNAQNKLLVEDAYVIFGVVGDKSFGNKSGSYYGNYDLVFKNSVVTANGFKFYADYGKTVLVMADTDLLVNGVFMTNDADSQFTFTNSVIVSKATSNGSDDKNQNAGEIDLVNTDLTYNATFTNVGTVNMDLVSTLTAPAVAGDGKIVIDASSFTGAAVQVITADMSGFTGTIEVTGHDDAICVITETGVIVKDANVAVYNGVKYTTLEEALEAAETDGGTVMLLDNCVSADRIASVPAGVTLDLNGNTLEVNNIWSFGQIVDGTVGGEGALIVNGNVILDENNKFLPLYDTAIGGYRFYSYGLRGRGVKVSGSGDSLLFKYGFAVDFDNADAYLLMKDTANSGLKLKVDIKWTDMPSGKTVTYTVSDATVADFAENAYEDIVVEGTTNTTSVVVVSITGLSGFAAGTEVTATMNIHTAGKVISTGASCTGTIEGE